jgi:hypothetical protein
MGTAKLQLGYIPLLKHVKKNGKIQKGCSDVSHKYSRSSLARDGETKKSL